MAIPGQRRVGVALTSLLAVWTSPPASRAITFTLIQPGTNTFLGSDGSTSGWYTSPADSATDNKWSFIGGDLLAYPRTENAPDLLSILRGLDPTHRYDVYFQYYGYNNPSNTTAYYGSTAKLDGGNYSQFTSSPGTAVTLETGYLGRVQGVDQAWMSFRGEFTSSPAFSSDRRVYVNSIGVQDLGIAPEVTSQPTGTIFHQQDFRGEREQFGYNPRYWPNTPGFDASNAPYIRVGKTDGKPLLEGSYDANQGYVMTKGADGNWISIRFDQAIKAKYPSWDGRFAAGESAEEHVVFDKAGDAYMIVNTSVSTGIGVQNLLLYSRDHARTWDVYPLPASQWARLEVPDAASDLSRPPMITGFSGFTSSALSLYTTTKLPNGTLGITSKQLVAASANSTVSAWGAGLGNVTYTRGDRTHLVYLSNTPVAGSDGTPQYIVTYDRSTNTVSAPVLLGVNGHGGPDVHNGPAITADSKSYLHVILGGHHDNLMYTRSLEPNSSTGGWTTPVPIGRPINIGQEGGYSYPSVVMDSKDTLHVVARSAWDGYRFGLDYMRKTANGAWEDRGHLVMPFHPFYSNWYEKLTVDDQDRLFLTYMFYGDEFSNDPSDPSGDEVAMYNLKYPDAPISLAPGSRTDHGNYLGTQPHDPVMLMSSDGGNTWRLTTSADLGVNIVPEPSTTFMLGLIVLGLQRRGRSARTHGRIRTCPGFGAR